MSESKGRIVRVGRASYSDEGLPLLGGWTTSGGEVGWHCLAYGPDDVVMAGWTFRELHAIANGTGPDIESVRELSELPPRPPDLLPKGGRPPMP